ncbi:unnamed protein product [Schistosoma margrebowiei]|uniref:Uncharacterized protein n=1 Tax=Schistosoma margrebowiei TaxID=48269 RepID=A0A183LDS1_9TREM|nr:unnamed protein product [Schistosoma margrebowiei]
MLNALNVLKFNTHAVCKTTVHFVASNDKLYNSDSVELNVSNKSYFDQIHDIILPDIRCLHDSCISNEIIYKYVKDMSSSPNRDQKSDVILSDVVCSSDSLSSSKILIRCEERVINELEPDNTPYGVASDVISSQHGFIFHGILN